jgi:hypothetical protein
MVIEKIREGGVLQKAADTETILMSVNPGYMAHAEAAEHGVCKLSSG